MCFLDSLVSVLASGLHSSNRHHPLVVPQRSCSLSLTIFPQQSKYSGFIFNLPSLLTIACVGAVFGSESGFCIGCAEACWPVVSPGPAASHGRGCAVPGWPLGDALVDYCRPLPSAGWDFYPAGPTRFQPDHGRSRSLSGNARKYSSTTVGNYIWIFFKTMLCYLRGKTAPLPADMAHVPFSFCELVSGCS